MKISPQDHDQLATLQSDSTYVTLSRLVILVEWWHNGDIIYCVSTTDDTRDSVDDDDNVDKFQLVVQYPPVVVMKHKRLVVDEGSNLTIGCGYSSFPAGLTNIQIYHDFKEIGIDYSDTGDTVLVNINNVTLQHQGEYFCALTNSIGKQQFCTKFHNVMIFFFSPPLFFFANILYKTLLSSGQSRPSVGDLTEVIVVARPEVVISIASSGQQSNETTVIESDLANISLSCDLVPGQQPTRHQVIRHKTRHKHARYKQGE